MSSRTASPEKGGRRFAAAGRGGYCAAMPDPVAHASFLPPVLIFCAAAVIAVPLFRRLGLSGVLGYLAAGIVIGPSGLSLIGEPETVRGVAELGVVLLLFIVGLELKLSRLISMRRDIFGLGAAQLGVTVAVFAAAAVASGLVLRSAVVVGHRAGAVGDLDRAADARGARRPPGLLRPALLRHPAVPGPLDRADPGPDAAPRVGRGVPRARRQRRHADRHRDRARRACRGRPRRALRPQPVLPAPRLERRPRGDDRLGAARRARRRARHGEGRAVDGDGRLPRRRAPRRVRTSATSSRPTSSRSAACCSGSSS